MSLILAVPVAAGGNALVDAPGPAERAASSRGSGVDSHGAGITCPKDAPLFVDELIYIS